MAPLHHNTTPTTVRGSARAPLADDAGVDAMDVTVEPQDREQEQGPEAVHREGGRAVAIGDDLAMEASGGGDGEEDGDDAKTRDPRAQQEGEEATAGDGGPVAAKAKRQRVEAGVEAPPSSPERPGDGGRGATVVVSGSAERKESTGDAEAEEKAEEEEDEVTVVCSTPGPALPDIPTNEAHVTKRAKGVLQFTVALEPPVLPLAGKDGPAAGDDQARSECEQRAAAIAKGVERAVRGDKEAKTVTAWVEDAKGVNWRLMYFPYGNKPSEDLRSPHTFKLSLYVEMQPRSMKVGKEGKAGEQQGAGGEEDKPAGLYCRRYIHMTLRPRHHGGDAAAASAMKKVGRFSFLLC